MSDNKNVDSPSEKGQVDVSDTNITTSDPSLGSTGNVGASKSTSKVSSSSERQIKFEKAQRCLENAALVSKRIKEHRKATAELLGRPFDDDGGDTASEMATTMSERTGYSAATDVSTTLSVQDALNIPGISESLANTLKQKELLMERIKQYKEISKRPATKSATTVRRGSVTDNKADSKKPKDVGDLVKLQNLVKEKENALSIMQVRIKAMETTIMDLQEKISEKDQVIEAKTKATSIISDSLSKKEKDSMMLLEDTREQMTKMQENFITMQSEWKEEKEKLLKEIETKDNKISSLEEANKILENTRFELTVAQSKLADELETKTKLILELESKLQDIKLPIDDVNKSLPIKFQETEEKEKGSIEIENMAELTKRIELLEQLNCQIRQTNKELELKLATQPPENKVASSPTKGKSSPLPSRKGRNTASKVKSPWSNLQETPQDADKKPKAEPIKQDAVIQSLNKDILDKEYVISQKDELVNKLQTEIEIKTSAIRELENQLSNMKLMVSEVAKLELRDAEINTDFIPELVTIDTDIDSMSIDELKVKLKSAEDQIVKLNEEIDTANKNMIKVKSNNKIKLKQMQKTIDNISKVTDANSEIVRLNEELHQLTQKVAELEEEKGNLQLHLVDYDSGRLTESDLYKKMIEMEKLAESRLNVITTLETQKFDLVQELHVLQQKNVEMEDRLADMTQLESEQVCSEMKSVQLEEQIDQLTEAKKELEHVIEKLNHDKEELSKNISLLHEEKEEIIHKLEQYIQENMDLTDKLEKLSAEKVSSAESIEIVESLTIQEKLELEEYNKGLLIPKEAKTVDDNTQKSKENIEQLITESEELNRKIELFTQERQEVMEKMTKITNENEQLKEKIEAISTQANSLQSTIETINQEKNELQMLNQTLIQQIEELKLQRIDIMKESVESTKSVEEIEHSQEPVHDEKTTEKGINRNKSVKQLTKEILKLKNIIKEREAEICDCQMKILSLEEQQEKRNEMFKNYEKSQSKLDSLTEENVQLKGKLSNVQQAPSADYLRLQDANNMLQQELHNIRQEYYNTISTRDLRIQELEKLLLDYEQQIQTYGSSLQQKDKELNEYINQVTKLNDVSQKLKSTIEVLEEEKANDQTVELVKSLNKQIAVFQKKLAECNEALALLEDERNKLINIRSALENKNKTLEHELKELKNDLAEKQMLIKELQEHKDKHSDEVAEYQQQAKEKDEEIHEIKLQLRKESIEKEKLRNMLEDKMKNNDGFNREFNELKEKYNVLVNENKDIKLKHDTVLAEKEEFNNLSIALETKQRETLDKLKKYAATLKKRNQMYAELEAKLIETQNSLETKNQEMEQMSLQLNILPSLQEKLKYAEEEVNRLHLVKSELENEKQISSTQINEENIHLQQKLICAQEEIQRLNESLSSITIDLQEFTKENNNLNNKIRLLTQKLSEYELEQKKSLEIDEHNKNLIAELYNKLENNEVNLNQVQFGFDAKLQEKDMYIENLESEINMFKNRIYRLEESVSVMEGRRHSLERKADQLDTQLLEKQKAYSEYIHQEDELVNRLSVLMDHDAVLENKLHELENENKELQNRIQELNENNQHLKHSFSVLEEQCNVLKVKASEADFAETNAALSQSKIKELEAQLKKNTTEHQAYVLKTQRDFEELETESNAQIENAIKEKKVLTEKCEKLNEHIQQLDQKLQEYHTNVQNLNLNIEEISKLNQQLMQNKQTEKPDYTEQYINEINKLNALVNSKNQEVYDIQHQYYNLQSNSQSNAIAWDSKITELNNKIVETSLQLEVLANENTSMQNRIVELQNLLQQKDDYIKDISDKKTVMFEMNIPKTEGMVISSTIEQIKGEPKLGHEEADLKDQIITSPDTPDAKTKTSEKMQTQTKLVEEPVVVAKKAYLCYKSDDTLTSNIEESDPFNSDEGWGLGETNESEIIMPGFTQLNDKLTQVKTENEALKSELATVNAKFMKAMKKLKELKSSNEMLSKELKTTKQLQTSQSSFLDSAIEDELKINIQELEKKIYDLNLDMNRNKSEMESLRKQNEVLNNANDKLMEMKEKMDNEVELWKFKFKEVNDKMSNNEWGRENLQSNVSVLHSTDQSLKEDLIKLEKENDELQSIIDQVTAQNKQHKQTIESLSAQIQQLANQQSNDSTELLHTKINTLEIQNNELNDREKLLTDKLQQVEQNYNEVTSKCVQLEQMNVNISQQSQQLELHNEKVSIKYQALEKNLSDIQIKYKEVEDAYNNLLTENNNLREEYQSYMTQNEEKNKLLEKNFQQLDVNCERYKTEVNDSKNTLSDLSVELEKAKSKIILLEQQSFSTHSQSQEFMMAEKINSFESQHSQLSTDLQQALEKVSVMESRERELLEQINKYEDQLNEANNKITQLNSENDQLLSTVTELRSSISSAMDQRGFEIAELWKQHLAQRETEFQKLEQDLRLQLHTSETKYEQLLDGIQSSSQEETNKLVMIEQINSLQSKIQDKDEHLNALQTKYAEAVNQLEMLRSELDDDKTMQENKLLNQIDEYEKTIKELDARRNQLEQENINITQDLESTKEFNAQLNIKVEELNGVIKDLEENILDLTNELREKDVEIQHKTHDLTMTLKHRNDEFEVVRKELLDYERKLEDLNYEKEAELAVIRLKMHEDKDYYDKMLQQYENEKTSLGDALNAKILECANLNRQITDLNKSLEEYELKAKESQAVLENQEIDIVTLKEEIQNLEQILKNTNSKISKHVTFSSDTKTGDKDFIEQGQELMDLVPKAEVDLAMYMLHQRDVRCEELTMELTQLLEERDTLQIRLSDSIRSLEELKNQCKLQGVNVSLSSISEASIEPTAGADRETGAIDVHRASSRSSSISDMDGDKPHLQAKLSELRTVKHSRDVTLRHDSQQRELSMRLLHRDVANLPPEAVEQLQQAHHTLARDSQSTPTVLLNWLRGKSTPKVVHM